MPFFTIDSAIESGNFEDKPYRKVLLPKEKYLALKQALISQVNNQVSEYQSFVDAVVNEVQEKTGYNPYTTSMVIYSTMNTDFQRYLNDII